MPSILFALLFLALLKVHRLSPLESFSLQWIKNDSRYTFLKESKEGAHEGSKEIWIAWPGKGKRKLLVAADALVPEGDDDPLKISRY